MAQRHDQPAGGPRHDLLGTGGGSGSGIGYEPGPAPGACAAVVDGPGDGVYGNGVYGEALYGADGGARGAARAGCGDPAPYGQDDGPGGGPGLGGRTAGEVLAGYLHRQSTDFLRSLRLHREAGPDAAGAGEAAWQLRRTARRISATLHTFRPLTEEVWADQLRAELGWLSTTLAREQACEARRDRLMGALTRLTGRGERADRPAERGGRGTRSGRGARSARDGRPAAPSAATPGASTGSTGAAYTAPPAAATEPEPESALAAGAARAGALLDRQLTLARARAHSAALQALGSSRFHAVADAVAVLASEAPLARRAGEVEAAQALPPLAEQAHRRLAEAVATLPLARAGHPYNAGALAVEQGQDAPWHRARLLVRISHYAQEVIAPDAVDPRLFASDRVLTQHRDAAEAAAAAATAARTPRIAPATAYALGVLHADQRHEVEAARYAFGRVWLPGPAGERGA